MTLYQRDEIITEIHCDPNRTFKLFSPVTNKYAGQECSSTCVSSCRSSAALIRCSSDCHRQPVRL